MSPNALLNSENRKLKFILIQVGIPFCVHGAYLGIKSAHNNTETSEKNQYPLYM